MDLIAARESAADLEKSAKFEESNLCALETMYKLKHIYLYPVNFYGEQVAK